MIIIRRYKLTLFEAEILHVNYQLFTPRPLLKNKTIFYVIYY